LLLLVIVLLVANCLLFYQGLNHLSTQSLHYITVVLFLISLIFSAWFDRARYFFVLLLFLCVYLFRYYLYTCVYGLHIELVYILISLLVVFNLMVFSLVKERGIWSFWGRTYLFCLFIQGVGFYFLIAQAVFLNTLYEQHIRMHFFLSFPYFQTLIITLGATTYMLLSYYRDQDYGSYVGLLIAALLPLFYNNHLTAWSVFYGAAALIGTVEIIINLYKMAFLDELTGLAGRRALRQDTLKLSGVYTLAMLDIDFFKSVNDRYGHDVGDQVLKYIASLVKKVTGGGKAYRYGGEEFTLVFPGKRKNEILPHLEALRSNIAQRPFVIRAKNRPKQKPEKTTIKSYDTLKIKVTVSIGVADNHRKNVTPHEVMKEADQALYKAKKTGRNRVCWAR